MACLNSPCSKLKIPFYKICAPDQPVCAHAMRDGIGFGAGVELFVGTSGTQTHTHTHTHTHARTDTHTHTSKPFAPECGGLAYMAYTLSPCYTSIIPFPTTFSYHQPVCSHAMRGYVVCM